LTDYKDGNQKSMTTFPANAISDHTSIYAIVLTFKKIKQNRQLLNTLLPIFGSKWLSFFDSHLQFALFITGIKWVPSQKRKRTWWADFSAATERRNPRREIQRELIVQSSPWCILQT